MIGSFSFAGRSLHSSAPIDLADVNRGRRAWPFLFCDDLISTGRFVPIGRQRQDGGVLNPIDEAQIRAADRLRDVMHAFMAHEQDPAVLTSLADALEGQLPALTTGSTIDRSGEDWAATRSNTYVPDDGDYFVNDLRRPFSGAGNPFSVPYEVRRNGDRIEATVVLRPAFEGAPKRSHGGFVAAIFDDLAGYLLARERRVAFTAWIHVDYKAPTPIGEPIVYRSWVDTIEERKLRAAGDCIDESGGLLATFEALFITPRALVSSPGL